MDPNNFEPSKAHFHVLSKCIGFIYYFVWFVFACIICFPNDGSYDLKILYPMIIFHGIYGQFRISKPFTSWALNHGLY